MTGMDALGDGALPVVEGVQAWTAEDMRDPAQWMAELTPAQVRELEQAAEQVIAGGRDLAQVGKADFPLPTMGPLVAGWLDALLHGRGFQLVRGLPMERYSVREAATIFWGVGMHMGWPASQNGKGHLLGHVRSLGFDLNDPNVRVYQTTERQTFHTDSCDVVGLICLQTAREGGLSSVVSSMAIFNEMARVRPDLARRLMRPMAVDRRGEVPEGQLPYFMLPVFNHFEGKLSCIYARRYINSAQVNFPDAPRLTEADIEALDMLDALAEDPRMHIDMKLERGDMQFVHNHTILHDRTAYTDWEEPERKRHLLRLWLAPDGARPLPPDFAQRYGSVEVGRRGGIIVRGTALHAPLEPV